MSIRVVCAICSAVCGAAVLFVDLKANDIKVLAAGVILAAAAAVIDR